jgi:hypothetical protein
MPLTPDPLAGASASPPAEPLLTPGTPAAILVALLGRAGVTVREFDDAWIASERRRGVPVSVGAFTPETVQAVVAAGRARIDGAPGRRALLAREAGDGHPEESGATGGLRTDAPLETMARRRDQLGRPMIDVAALQAGRRFQSDFRRAGLMPRLGMDWSGTVADGGRIAGQLDPTEAAAEARRKVHRAMDALGPELSGPLIDLCAFEKGLEAIERERRWPVRSAKVVVGIGLAVLARHYGLAAEARGRPPRA